MFSQLWVLPCLIALELLPSDANRWARYAAMTALIGYPYPHAMQVAWCSRISNSVRTRTISAAIYNSKWLILSGQQAATLADNVRTPVAVQVHGIISANVYREDDRPYYRRGNKVLICIAVMNIGVYLFAKAYYQRQNKVKRRQWNALSHEEQRAYLETTKDEGNKRLDFFFVS